MKFSLFAPLVIALGVSVSSLAHADFTNGSFEDPSIGPANAFVAGPGDVPGWDITASGIISNGYIGSGTTWHDTPAGQQYIYVSQYTGTDSVSQSVALSAGSQKLSFLQADFASGYNTPGGELSLSITRTSDGAVILSPTEFDTADFSDFITQNVAFTVPTADQYTFSFTGISQHAAIIDNVSVQAVPEPTTMAVLGLGVLGIVRRRRKA